MTDSSGPMPVREGDLVAGKYRVEGVIGTGGMGVVVSARHEQLDQRVAIKFVRNLAFGNEEGVERFVREARAAVKLRSEHAARVLDVGTLESGVPYMVMELLEGCDLAQVLAERGPLPVELAAEWMAQACEALAEAHAAGIVHRDLKPQNLFLARTVGGAEHIKVLDFGVSKSIETMTSGPGALTRTSAMLGSPLYMAPEQMRSARDVDARVDVWALGVVLFELLTQRWPFEAETLPDLCLKVVGDPPQSLAELRVDIPDIMVRAVGRCLEKDRHLRFANAAEFAFALEPLLPPRSRLLVHRAQLAMSHALVLPTRPADAGARESLPQGSELPAPPAPTPTSWDSRMAAGPEPSKGGSARALRVTAAVLAVVIGAIALWLLTRPEGAQREASVSSAPIVATHAVTDTMASLRVATPVTAAVPLPSASAPEEVADPANANKKNVSLTLGAPKLGGPKPVIAGSAAAARTAPSAKPFGPVDDIPALR